MQLSCRSAQSNFRGLRALSHSANRWIIDLASGCHATTHVAVLIFVSRYSAWCAFISAIVKHATGLCDACMSPCPCGGDPMYAKGLPVHRTTIPHLTCSYRCDSRVQSRLKRLDVWQANICFSNRAILIASRMGPKNCQSKSQRLLTKEQRQSSFCAVQYCITCGPLMRASAVGLFTLHGDVLCSARRCAWSSRC